MSLLAIISLFFGLVVLLALTKWILHSLNNILFRGREYKVYGLRKWRLHYAEVLLLLIITVSIWQYTNTGEVHWLVDGFRMTESRTTQIFEEAGINEQVSRLMQGSDDQTDSKTQRLTQERVDTPTSYDMVGRVERVIDGDTITIESQGQQYKIRLHGIDTPERKQPFGRVATKTISKWVAGKDVVIDVKDTDSYGRTVGIVFVKDKNINLEMVCTGHAWWYRRYAKNDKELQNCEAEAREQKLGLWANPNPTPPWDWRRGITAETLNSGLQDQGCGTKSTCAEMTDCNEAFHYLNYCGLSRLDDDKDGVPCESLCR